MFFKSKTTKYFFSNWFQSYRNQYSTVGLTQAKLPAYLSSSNSIANEFINENFVVHEDFVSEIEEQNLMIEIEQIFKRRRYEFNHWDGVSFL